MSADPNTGFGHGFDPSSHYNRRIHSFHADAANSTSEMVSGIKPGSTVNYSTAGNFLSGSSSVGSSSAGTSFASGHREIVRGLKHDSGLAVDWTYEEQNLLNEGLIRFAGESHIMKYVKIAALFPNKSVRDIALRIRWLVRQLNFRYDSWQKHEIAKRHKLEEHFAGKRIRERKEKMLHSHSSRNVHILHSNNIPYSPMTHHANCNNSFSCEVSTLDGTTQQLMDDTNQFLSQIAANIELFKLEDNVDLFCHTRNNILLILNSMTSMPGIMSQMPPLPISVNDELLCAILPNTSQAQKLMFGSQDGINVQQEPSGSSLLL